MMDQLGTLYVLSFPDGKQYVGITSKTAAARFRMHARNARDGADYAVSRAIRQHGPEAVKVETLLYAPIPMLKEIEPLVIQQFSTKAPAGYNMTDGGEYRKNTRKIVSMKLNHSRCRFNYRSEESLSEHVRQALMVFEKPQRLTSLSPFQYLRKVRGAK